MNTIAQAKQALANKRLFAAVYVSRTPEAQDAAYRRFLDGGPVPAPVNTVRVLAALQDLGVFQAGYGHLQGWREMHQRMVTTGELPAVPPQVRVRPRPVAPEPVRPAPVPVTAARLAARWGLKPHQVLAALQKSEVWVEPEQPLSWWQVEAAKRHVAALPKPALARARVARPPVPVLARAA